MSCQVNSSDQKEDGQVQRVCSDVLCMVEDVKGSVGACTSILLRLVCGVCGTECSSVGRAIDCSVGCCISVLGNQLVAGSIPATRIYTAALVCMPKHSCHVLARFASVLQLLPCEHSLIQTVRRWLGH